MESENPWNIESIYELQYFNCPKCDFKEHSKQTFANHAFKFHPESISSLTNLKDNSLDDVVIDISDVKTEITSVVEIETEPTEPTIEIETETEPIEPTIEIETQTTEPSYVHINDADSENFQYQCQKCNHQTETVYDMKNHEKYVHKTKEVLFKKIDKGICILASNDEDSDIYDYKCKFDPTHNKGEPFQDKESLRVHYNKLHEGEKPENFEKLSGKRIMYHCQQCTFSGFILKNLKDHIEMQHNSKSSPKDSTVFPSKTPSKVFQCYKCGVRKYTMKEMSEHIQFTHKKTVQPEAHDDIKSEPTTDENAFYKCKFCNFAYSTLGNLKIHMNNNHKEKNTSKCQYCESSFVDLQTHIDRVHRKIRRFECTECGNRFFKLPELKSHIDVVHKKIKPYKCNLCPFRAINNGKLNYHHKIVHENLRLHPCKECDMDFKTPGTLKRHVQVVHEGMKPYKCNMCAYKTAKQDSLIKHKIKAH